MIINSFNYRFESDGPINTLNQNCFRSIHKKIFRNMFVIKNKLLLSYRRGKWMHYPESPKVNPRCSSIETFLSILTQDAHKEHLLNLTLGGSLDECSRSPCGPRSSGWEPLQYSKVEQVIDAKTDSKMRHFERKII